MSVLTNQNYVQNVPRMTALHVIGPPGCGKTLLCTKALELYQPMPNVIVDCKGYGSMKQVWIFALVSCV